MCGRYGFPEGIGCVEMQKNLSHKNYVLWEKGGRVQEITPSSLAAVITAGTPGAEARLCRWGFLSGRGKGLVINARAETAEHKPMFRDSVKQRRCVVPASEFYEWDQEKRRYRAGIPGESALFMAGLVQPCPDGDRFCILTVPAASGMELIHERMPAILSQDQVIPWLQGELTCDSLLNDSPLILHIEGESPQLCFW